jgi:predicted TIM-barrel fold metal-dependent hydrolase
MYDGPIVDSHHHLWEWRNYPWLVAPITPKMYGSNFPLEKLWASYDDLVATTKRILEKRPTSFQRKYVHDTASAFYRL